jgi:RecB family exonuclease
MTTDPRHGLPSASAFERLVECPPSHQMALGIEDTESAAAASGTRIHAVLANEADISTLSPDEEQTHDMCKAQADALIAEHITGTDVETLTEVRLGLTHFGRAVVVSNKAQQSLRFTGQADLIIIDGSHALIIDYKTGRGDTADAVDNHQLMALAALVSLYRPITSATVAIVQPWAGKPTVAQYDLETLRQAEAKLISTLNTAEQATAADAVAGNHCKWCKAKMICPAFQAAALSVTDAINIESISGNDEQVKAQIFSRMGNHVSMSNEMLIRIQEGGRKYMEWFLVAHDLELRRRISAGEIDGYSLRERKGRRSVSDVTTVFSRLSTHGVTGDAFAAECSIPLGSVKTLIKQSTGAKGKALDNLVDEVLHGATEISKGSFEIVKNNQIES